MICSTSPSSSRGVQSCFARTSSRDRQAAADMRPMVESRGIDLAIQVAPDLPFVFVDARQIGHVFSNLISNAVAHSKPGDEILIAANSQNGSVRFSVTDHGPGIPAEHQARLFERFFGCQGRILVEPASVSPLQGKSWPRTADRSESTVCPVWSGVLFRPSAARERVST